MQFDASSLDDSVYVADFSVQPPPDTIHVRKSGKTLVVADTPRVAYVGTPHDLDCQYLVGVVDHAAKKIRLHRATALSVRPVVKATLADASRLIAEKVCYITQNADARNQLGQAFGTKKRRAIIKATEINRVDVATMHDVQETIKTNISSNMADMPDKGTPTNAAGLEKQMLDGKFIPPCNPFAATPDLVYSMADIAPEALLKLINIKDIWAVRLTDEAWELLGHLDVTSWVWSRIELVLSERNDKPRLRQLLYLAYLCRFYRASSKDVNRPDIADGVFGGISPMITDHIRATFCDVSKQQVFKITPQLKDKLLSYILAASLLLNSMSIDPAQIGNDLAISGTKYINTNIRIVKVARELGCRVESVKRDGIPGKRVYLAMPLVFPTRTR